MAEKDEFKFPDEAEAKDAKADDKVDFEVEGESEPEIEVVDDTPPEDRGRKPMAEPPKEVTDEELAKYDESVQKRIKHFTKGYHEERRAKETAEREREEALKLAQTVLEENKKLKGSVNQNQAALLEQAKKVVSSEVENAKRMYKEAYESGDSDKLVEAQEALTIAKIRADKVNNFKPTPLQEEETPVQIAQQPTKAAPVDEKLLAWQDQNQWFGSNKRMTAYALGLHEDLVSEGIPSGSDEYYRRINADIRERFSDQFGAEESVDAKPQRTKSNIVAPATRSTAPKKIVLTQTQVNIAKRLGVPLDLYARKVAEEQLRK
jgi:membrane-associated HD superfamily phosphohydrolase